MEKYNISLIIPAYNEEGNIAEAISSSLNILQQVANEYEIIIINDGSSDKTEEISNAWQEKNQYIKIIHLFSNKGVGNALKMGFNQAKYELIFWIPGDNQVKSDDLPKFLSVIENADIVAGFRIKRQDPFIRKFNANLYKILLFIFFGLKIKDVDCNKLFRKKVFEKIKIESTGQLIDAEILIKAKKLKFKIKEIGIPHYPRIQGFQTGGKIKNIFKAWLELIKLWKYLK
ncbi:MAG: glycosyltransferase family 2 protein [bacterium]